MTLSEPTPKVLLAEPLVYNNAKAHAMQLTVLNDDGTDASLSGVSVAGTMMLRGNGTTVTPLNGSVSGNVAQVILPAACYAVPGRFTFIMNMTKTGGYTRGALIVEGRVERTTTGSAVDPGTPVTDYSTIIANANAAADAATAAAAQIPDVESAVAPSYSDLMEASPFVALGAYEQYCWYNDQLYVNKVNISAAENWTASHWEAVDVSGELYKVNERVSDLKTAICPKLYNQQIIGNPDLFAMAGNDLFEIDTTPTEEVTLWSVSDSTYTEVHDGTKGTPMIKCPKYLAFLFHNSDERMRIYFYRYANGSYTRDDTILSINLGTNANLLRLSSILNRVIPAQDSSDNLYMQIAVTAGNPRIFGWTGKHVGMETCGTTSVPYLSGGTNITEKIMRYGASAITVPGSAKYLIGKDVCFNYIYGVHDDGTSARARTSLSDSDASQMFVELPDGYDYFRVRLRFNYSLPYNSATASYSDENITSSLDDHLCVVVKDHTLKPAPPASAVIDKAKVLANVTWTAKKEQNASDNMDKFLLNKTYSGVPYHSNWAAACQVGYHISMETLLNAINDADSIFYTDDESVVRGGPYYGLVCTSFGCLCAGWPYPMTNETFHVHPKVKMEYSFSPAPGTLFSNRSKGHSVIVEQSGGNGDDNNYLCLYEQVSPKTSRTILLDNVKTAWDDWTKTNESRYNYLYNYIYCSHHIAENPSESAPYDIAKTDIANGNARPYKGNKCVYTSAEDVKINIKAGTTLYLQPMTYSGGTFTPIGDPTTFSVSTGSYTIDKSNLTSGGIYGVKTNTDVYEYFEYRDVSGGATMTVDNGNLVFKDGSNNALTFWYAHFSTSAVSEGYPMTIGYESDGNYQDYVQVFTPTADGTVYFKGMLGAYAASLVLNT